MEKVYEEVDEDQYSRMVRERQDNDWIIDDGEFIQSHKLMISVSYRIERVPNYLHLLSQMEQVM